jgi:hypothetical protein
VCVCVELSSPSAVLGVDVLIERVSAAFSLALFVVAVPPHPTVSPTGAFRAPSPFFPLPLPAVLPKNKLPHRLLRTRFVALLVFFSLFFFQRGIVNVASPCFTALVLFQVSL